jgi:hypothetical protein
MTSGEKPALGLSFDPTIDVISFTLADPMNYKTRQVTAQMTEAGLQWGSPKAPSSSSDEEYVPRRAKH